MIKYHYTIILLVSVPVTGIYFLTMVLKTHIIRTIGFRPRNGDIFFNPVPQKAHNQASQNTLSGADRSFEK